MSAIVETAAPAEPAALLSVSALAKLLDVSPRHVWRLRDAGELPAPIKLGRLIRWRREAVLRWLAEYTPQSRGGAR